MNGAAVKIRRKEIKRAIGEDAADLLADLSVRTRAHAAILRRGFFGRLKWLLFGR